MSIEVKMDSNGKVTGINIDAATSQTFSDAITAAIKDAGKKAKSPQPPQTPTGGNQSGGTSFGLPDMSGMGSGDLDTFFPQFKAMTNLLPTSVKKTMDTAREGLEQSLAAIPRKAHDYFVQFDGDIRSFYFKTQEALGGIPITGEEATNELSKKMQKGFDNIYEDANSFAEDITDMNLVLELDTGSSVKNVNLIDNALGGAKQVLQDFNSLVLSHSKTLGPKFAEALEDQEYQVTRFNKGLGLNQQQIAGLLSRQIALTGEASTQMLEDLQTQSHAIAEAVGGNAKLIAQQSAEIIKDVKNFGNVTVEEATRMAAAMQNAGIEFSAFTSMLGKFQNFDTATKAMSDLTAVFGIHMDSMELMMLANEDQEAFMYRIKEGFEAQGLAMEDMNLAQKRVLADTMGINVQQAELFFQEGALPDQAEMEQASITANAEEAIQKLNKDIANLVHSGKSVEEVLKSGVKESFVAPLQKAAYRNANVIRTGAAAVSEELKKAASDSGKDLLETFSELSQAINEGKSEAEITAIMGGYGTKFLAGMKGAAQGAVDAVADVFSTFADDWWQPNVGANSPSPLFGVPFLEGIVAAIPLIESDLQESFLAISDSMANLVADTGLPSILDDLNESTMIATSIAGEGTTGVSQSIQVLNEAAIDNFPKMVEKLEKLNTLLEAHVNNVESGVETNLAVSLSLDKKTLYEELVNYKHVSGGSFSLNSGETTS